MKTTSVENQKPTVILMSLVIAVILVFGIYLLTLPLPV